MNKSITQDMAYRQSLMKYAEKYGVSRASRKYQQESVLYLLLVRTLGRKCRIPGLPVTTSSQSSELAHRSGTEANFRYAPPQSAARLGRAVAPPETARLYPPVREPVSGYVQTGNVPAGEGEKDVHAKTLSVYDSSWRKDSDGCKGRPTPMHRWPGSIHRH